MSNNDLDYFINEVEFKTFIHQNIEKIENFNFEVITSEYISENTIEADIQVDDLDNEEVYILKIEIEINNVTGVKYKLLELQEHNIDLQVRENKLSFDIDYWAYNITYDQLSRLYKNDKIIIPDMQRGYVWDQIQASKLIESIFMGLPLPSLFLIKQEDGKYVVVDGLQRITTISCFRYNLRLPNQEKQSGFSLKGVNRKLLGKTYEDLSGDSELMDRFDMGTINVIEFKQNKPDYEEAMYFLFERLNSGGTSLSDQQIRNSVSYGPFNQKLNELAKDKLSIFFSKKAKENLLPSETLLRAISVYDYIVDERLKDVSPNETERISGKKNLVYKTLLNKTADKYHLKYKKVDYGLRLKNNEKFEESESGKQYISDIESMFVRISQAIDSMINIFQKDVFKRMEEGVYKARLSPIIFESVMVTTLLYYDELEIKNTNDIFDSYASIFNSSAQTELSKYELYFTQGTGQIKNLLGRIETMKEVLFYNG